MDLYKIAVVLLTLSSFTVTGLRLTRYSNFAANAGSCTALDPLLGYVLTYLLPNMVFNDESGILDNIVALIPQTAVDASAFLTIGLWNKNNDGSFTLRKILVDSPVTKAGLLNVTFGTTELMQGDYFAFTLSTTYPVCKAVEPAGINYQYIFHGLGSSKPRVGDSFPVQSASSPNIFAIAADISQVVFASTTTGLPTSAATTMDTFSPSPSASSQTSQPPTTLFTTQQSAPMSTASPLPRFPENFTFLCQSPTNPCDSNSVCEQTFYGVRCLCKQGFRSINATACADINECAEDNVLKCQQMCQNTPGSYSCSCRNGFTLTNDGHRCTEQNLCSVPSSVCDKNLTCHSAGGYLQCLPPQVRLENSVQASSASQLIRVDLPQNTWISNVWVIVFIVWSGLLSVLVIVLIAWMAHEMRQTKLAIEMEMLLSSQQQDSASAYSGSTLRHGMRFHDGTFTAMKPL